MSVFLFFFFLVLFILHMTWWNMSFFSGDLKVHFSLKFPQMSFFFLFLFLIFGTIHSPHDGLWNEYEKNVFHVFKSPNSQFFWWLSLFFFFFFFFFYVLFILHMTDCEMNMKKLSSTYSSHLIHSFSGDFLSFSFSFFLVCTIHPPHDGLWN